MFRILLICMLPVQAMAAGINLPDTLITLDEVQVSTSRHRLFDAGHQIMFIDSMALHNHQHQSIDQLLKRHSGIFIKNYGPGILATTSLRGGSAAQTALVWNGFHIQNPMHGQTDLALIPTFFTDQVNVQYGGASALWGGGGMGGVIHMQNTMPEEKGFTSAVGFSGSDTGEFIQQVSLGGALGPVNTRLRVFNMKSENRYQYINTYLASQPRITQAHAGAKQQGILQEIHFQPFKGHSVDIRGWWQDNSRQIPPTILQHHQGGYQEDVSLRLTGQWTYAGQNMILSWRGAYFDEHLFFRDSLNQESQSTSQTISQEAEISFGIRPGLMGNTGVHIQNVNAWSAEYANAAAQSIYAVFSNIKWELFPGSLHLQASARQEFTLGQQIPFAPSFGLSWKISPVIYLKANAGKSFRIPSLNDRYWVPGGNPALKPESGWSQDLSINVSPEPGSMAGVNRLSLTGFHRKINDWIIWLPTRGSMHWSPENIMQVRSYGLEARLHGELGEKPINVRWELLWDHTRAINMVAKSPNDASKGKQLIYVPKNLVGLNLNIMIRQFGIILHQSYTDKRYTSSDNSQWLEPYFNMDLSAFWEPASARLTVFTSVHNLFNESYQVMSGRPMPLRHFRAGIRYTTSWKSTTKM